MAGLLKPFLKEGMSLCQLQTAQQAGEPFRWVWSPPPALSTVKKLHKEIVLLLPVLLEDGTQAGTTADVTQTKPCICQHHWGL